MRRVLLALCLLVSLTGFSILSGAAGAAVDVKSGRYSGATTQQAVAPQFRGLAFRVTKKRRVILTAEPVVAKGLCLSSPVFTLEGTATKRLNSRGVFSFTKTFVGSKFDRIKGRFVSPTEVEGFVVYHFNAQDLCAGGKVRVRFQAKRG